ncbi:MAG: hypothetical protein LKG11_02675 [Bacilli bacterium]|jgi:hypothetical protein|nr:hypothetical protein [Bacilli bacterium]
MEDLKSPADELQQAIEALAAISLTSDLLAKKLIGLSLKIKEGQDQNERKQS